MKKRSWIIFIWLFLLYSNGVIYFLQGFLLTRREIHLKSTVSDGVSCCLEPKYKQIIIFIIDALRYDFLLYNNDTSKENIPIYHNNLPVVQQLLKDNHGVLYQVLYITVPFKKQILFYYLVCCRSSNFYNATSEGYNYRQFTNFH